MSLTIKELIDESFKTAEEKGWHDKERSFGDIIALIHSEVSEAFEDYRLGRHVDFIHYDCDHKPHGIPIELADILIRIFDMCSIYDIDLERALEVKMRYNKERSYRHGGKKV